MLALRWHPFAIDESIDYSNEAMTLITFELEEVPEGTRVCVVESGFDNIPLARRACAFEANEVCWSVGLMLLQKFLAA